MISEKSKYFFTGFKGAGIVDPVSSCLFLTLWAVNYSTLYWFLLTFCDRAVTNNANMYSMSCPET